MEVILLTACVGKAKTLFRPLGSYQLAWYLRKFDYSVQVIDFLHRLTEQQIYDAIEKYIGPETKILGYGPMINLLEQGAFSNMMERILLKVRKKYPHINIIAGGAAAQFFVRKYRNKSLFDYIFMGHAEDTMLAFCNHVFRGAPAVMFEKLEGNNIIRETFPLPQIDKKFNIEECSHTWDDSDFVQPGESLPIELGRGCIFACKFCQYPYIGKDKDDFNRSMDLIREEIIRNYEKFGTTTYYMVEDTFNAHRERTKAFAEMVKTLPFKLYYSTYLRLDLIARWEEQEEILPESGLIGCYFGIESLNDEAARLINKGWNSKNAKEYLPYINEKWKGEVGFRVGLIAGLPPETYDDLVNTHQWCVDSNFPNWEWHPLRIFRNRINTYQSDFDRNAEQYGFEFVNDNGVLIWKTDYCDARKAVDWYDNLKNLAKPYQKLAWMQLIELGGLGYDMHSYKKQLVTDIDWVPINKSRDKFIENYYKQLMGKTD